MSTASRGIKPRGIDRSTDIVVLILLVILLIIIAYPLYFIIIASISAPSDVTTGKVLLFPSGTNFEGYKKILQYSMIWVGYRNSIIYAALGSTISVALSLMTAYVFTRRDLVGRKFLLTLFLIPMFFGGGLVPTYLWMRDLGLLNKPIILVLMGSVSMYNIIITRTFLDSNIPSELLDSARIDGCNNVNYFTRIVLPLSKAIIAVLFVFGIVAQWNSFFNALIYINNRKYYPLQLVLREILSAQTSMMQQMEMGLLNEDNMKQLLLAESMKYGVIIVSSIPMMLVYPFAQKYFIKGIMIGSIKG